MLHRLATILALAAATALPLQAGKVTVDPNAEGREPARKAAQAGDARLDQKITYYSGAKRLHTVASDLTEKTGVVIQCGSTLKDWQVRDIPVVVCAHDLPLGTLLKTLAQAAHVSLHTERPEDKKAGARYRLVRDKKTRDEIDAFFEARRKHALEVSNWAWDVLAQIGGMSDDDIQKMTAKDPRLANAVTMGRLIAALGPDAKARLFAGEPVSADEKSSPHSALVKQCCADPGLLATWSFPPGAQPDLSSYVAFRVKDAGEEPLGALVTTTLWAANTSGFMSQSLENKLPSDDRIAKLGFPARPKLDDRNTGPRAPTGFAKIGDAAEASLSREVRIEKLKGIEKPIFADAVTAISEAAEISIITEDFASHKLSNDSLQGLSVYGEKTPLSAMKSTGDTRSWFSSSDGKLVVGWRHDWQRSHAKLMPESVLEDLTAKLKGGGVSLDDFANLMLWSKEQRQEWIDRSGDLAPLGDKMDMGDRDAAVWKLYAVLTPQDKALAQSRDGLAFAKFDPQWLSTFLAEAMGKDSWSARLGPQYGEPFRQQTNMLTDASLVGGLKLTIIPNQGATATARSYYIRLSGGAWDSHTGLTGSGWAFPIKAGLSKH